MNPIVRHCHPTFLGETIYGAVLQVRLSEWQFVRRLHVGQNALNSKKLLAKGSAGGERDAEVACSVHFATAVGRRQCPSGRHKAGFRDQEYTGGSQSNDELRRILKPDKLCCSVGNELLAPVHIARVAPSLL